MKSLLTLAIVLSSATAFATRARVTALGNSPHIIDTALSAPDQLLPLADSLTIESGITAVTLATGINSGAQGSIYKTMGDGKLGLVLGRKDSMIYTNRAAALTAGLATINPQENPIEVSYGLRLADMNAGFGLIYSNYEDKATATAEKESSMGLRAGVSNSMFYANAKLIVSDKYEAGAIEYTGKSGFDIKGGYYFDDVSVHANIASTGFKVTNGGTDAANAESMTIAVQVIDTIKKESNFFYGAGLANVTNKESVADFKQTIMKLPLIIGLETPATSWLTFRGSITQDVIISNEKSETAGTVTSETAPGLNTTTLATGVGLVFNKVTLDGSIMTGGTQTINSANLLAQVGATYNF